MPIDGDVILKAGLDTSGINKQIENLKKSITRGLKNLIRIGFGVRSVFALIRKMRSALLEGFKDLAQVHEPFNDAMSDIMSSLRLLRNTFAAAFAPIIEVVAPILTKFINMVADAVAAVGQFIAALTGKEYVSAGRVQVDYAESVDQSAQSSKNATKATKAQTKAQKELNKEVTHFDDLVILHDKNTDNDDDSSPVSTPQTAFSTMPVGDAVSQFVKDFKAAWDTADFTDIGRKIGEKLKSALDSINWSGIRKTTNKIARSIATLINGFVETPGLWTSVGKTMGKGINTAVSTAEAFIRTLHWDSIAKAVRTTLVTALNTINWSTIYRTVNGFARGLASYLNELFKPDTFNAIGKTIAELLNTVLSGINTFGQTFDFTQFATSLASGINKALRTFKVSKLTSAINTFVINLRDAIIAFIRKVDWYKLGTTIRDAIKGIRWRSLLLGVGKIVWEAINGAITFFKGLFDTDNISTPVTEALNNLSETVSDIADKIDFQSISEGFDAMVTALTPAVEGFAAGFIDVLNVLAKLGIEFLNSLGPAFQSIADAFNSVPKESLSSAGQWIGRIAGGLLAVRLAKGGLTIIQKLFPAIQNAGNAASTASGLFGMSGLAGSLFVAASGAAAFFATLEATKTTIADTSEELNVAIPEYQSLKSAVEETGKQFGLTDEEIAEFTWNLYWSKDTGSDTAKVYEYLDKKLENAGISASDFKNSLSDVANKSGYATKNLNTLQDYITGVATESENADTQTSEFAGVFDIFDSLKISVPLKMLLISNAIKNMGDKGKLSDKEVNNLYDTLDEWNTNPTEKNMQKVAKAFDNSSSSVDDFLLSVTEAMSGMDKATQKEISKALKTIENSGEDIKKKTKTSYANAPKGAKEALDEGSKYVKNAASNMADTIPDATDDALDSHSPSKEMMKRGQYAVQGLIDGLKNKTSALNTAVDTVANNIVAAFNNKVQTFTAIGTNIGTKIQSGLTAKGNSLKTAVWNTMVGVYNKAISLSFWQVGNNIGTGIYNGLVANSKKLSTLAWNTAVGMYNSACRALRIASPSKKFAWIGKMVAQGLEQGVEDNADNAVTAVENMTEAITDAAEFESPTVTVGTSIDDWIDKLDAVLTNFSETIINRFDNLINTLSQLNNLSIGVPAIAEGRVIPASMQASTTANDNMTNMLGMLESLVSSRLTEDDLRSVLVEMFTRYMNLSWSIGDEQLARHVQRGNEALDRRYNLQR